MVPDRWLIAIAVMACAAMELVGTAAGNDGGWKLSQEFAGPVGASARIRGLSVRLGRVVFHLYFRDLLHN